MLAESSYAAIQYWVSFRFERTFDERDECVIVEHGETFADYHGVYVWRMGKSTLISAPRELVQFVSRAIEKLQLAGRPLTALTDEVFWHAALGKRVERIVGPAYQGFCDEEAFQPVDPQGARLLTLNDHHALRAFIAACPPDDWKDSSIDLKRLPIFGLERDGTLVAVASAPRQYPRKAGLRSIGVVTLPAWRGHGAGRAVVSALTAQCLVDGWKLHYQTLRANTASVAIAQALGFEDLATSLAVRLR